MDGSHRGAGVLPLLVPFPLCDFLIADARSRLAGQLLGNLEHQKPHTPNPLPRILQLGHQPRALLLHREPFQGPPGRPL